MSVTAQIVDGKVVNGGTTAQSASSTPKKAGSTLDKEAFLQLLVTQMKYQDPLEPTDNTEYVAQLATFSSLEQMQNIAQSMDLQRASTLVGKEVYLESTNPSTGETNSVAGYVDYVSYEGNKAYVSVNGSLYPIDEVVSVYDEKYTRAYEAAYDFTVALNKLPSAARLTTDDFGALEKLSETFESMDDYTKTFITQDNKDKLEALKEKMKTMKKLAEANEQAGTNSSSDSAAVSGEDKVSDDEKDAEGEASDAAGEAASSEAAGETEKAEETASSDGNEEDIDISGLLEDTEE